MKKFVIISTVLILLAAGFFGYSLYHYMDVSDLLNKSETSSGDTTATQADQTEATEPVGTLSDGINDGGIFSANYEKAAAYVENMSKEEMVGQMLLGVCTDASTAASEIDKYSLSGMLFKSDNFSFMTSEEVAASVKKVAADTKIKPILAAQEEGGSYTTVSDLSSFTQYDYNSPRTDFASGGLQAVEKVEDEKTLMLKSLGFNLNLAPVVDLPDSSDQIMYSRALTEDVDTVSAYAEYTAKFNQAKGVSVALKHFPGYGTIPDSANTGIGAVTDDRAADTIRNTDYQPFKKGAQAGAHFIMVSNVVVKNIDSAHTAALSPAIHSELRGNVDFSGLIMTDVIDDMDYSAYADGNKTAVAAVLAGNDIILVNDYATAYSDILAAVDAGTVSSDTLKNACTRIIAYKYTVGIMS